LILDTNALSAVADGDARAVEKFGAAHQVAVPVIVLGEFRYGIAQSRHRRQYERWLAELLSIVAVMAINEETTVRYAQLRVELKEAGTPLPANDVWIAALCRQYAQPILSRDGHFDAVKRLRRLDW
jgi:tRNA(fMet)-specific endonuclease VapC